MGASDINNINATILHQNTRLVLYLGLLALDRPWNTPIYITVSRGWGFIEKLKQFFGID